MAKLSTAVLGLVLVSCGDLRPVEDLPEVTPTAQVVLRPASIRLRAGENRQVSAQANSTEGLAIGGAPIEYKSLSPGLLRVSPTGLVSSIGAIGSGEILVSSGAASAKLPIYVVANDASALKLLPGFDAKGIVGQQLPTDLAIVVSDRDGNPVHGVVVDFVLPKDTGTIKPAHATTDEAGVVTASWTLGPRAGQQNLDVALREQPETSTSVRAQAVAGSPHSLRAASELDAILSGQRASIRAQVIDEFENPVPEVELQWSASRGELAEATPSDANGVASVEWTPSAAGPATISATGKVLALPPIEWTTEVRPGPPAKLEVLSGLEQKGRANRPAPSRPMLRVVDLGGNPVADADVLFSVKAGGGSLETELVRSDSEGSLSAPVWTWGEKGEQVLEASLPNTSVSQRLNGSIASGRGTRRGQ